MKIVRYFNILIISALFGLFLFFGCKKDELRVGEFEPGVALTFDDIFFKQWVDILQPVLNKYSAKASFFACFTFGITETDKSNLLTLYQHGNEIGSHTMNHLNIEEYLRNHNLHDYYSNEILPTLNVFNSLGISISSFSYPYGVNNTISNAFLSKYFAKIRGVGSLNSFVYNYGQQFIDGAFIDSGAGNNWAEIKNAIREAKRRRVVLVLIGHQPVKTGNEDWTFPVSLVDSICSCVRNNNMKFYRISDL